MPLSRWPLCRVLLGLLLTLTLLGALYAALRFLPDRPAAACQ